MPGKGNPLIIGPPSISGAVNTSGTPMGFAEAASNYNYPNIHEGELGSAMNFSGTNTTPTAGEAWYPGVGNPPPSIYNAQPDTFATGYNETMGVAQDEYEAAMDKIYANVKVGEDKDGNSIYGYTGQGAAGGRNPITGGGGGGTASITLGGGGGSGGVSQTPIPKVVLNPQDLSQRTPSGSMYAPDLSAYNDSSLFNYTGPGGVNEYTYGQNLPYQGAGYDIWGSPADAPNPYYEGQFGGGFVEPVAQGPADGAIGLPPIDLPTGVAATNNNPSVGSSNTNINTGGGSNDAGGGHDYWSEDNQRVYEMQQKRKEQSDAENYDAMAAQANAWDNQMRQSQVPEGLFDTGGGGRAIVDWVNTKTGETFAAPHTGFEPINPDWQTSSSLGSGPTKYLNSISDYSADSRFRPPEAGADSLARRVAAGMGENQAEFMAKGQHLQDMNDAFEARAMKDIRMDQHFDRNQAEYTPSIRDYYPGATPMQLHQGEVLNATKEGPKTGPSGLTADDLGLFDYSADDRFRQTPQSIADVDYNARPMNFADAAGTITDGAMNTQHPAYAAHQNRLENLFQNQDTGFPAETRRGSFAGSSADLGNANAIETSKSSKTGPSGKTATDVTLENLNKDAFRRNELAGGSGLFNSLDPIDMAIRAVTGFDTTQDAIDAHRANKFDDAGGGLAGYKDESTDGYTAVSGNPYHIRSGRDVGNLSGDENLPLGGIPAALAGGLFQQFDDFGKEGLLQSIDNARGLALSGNAPAVQSIFDAIDSGTEEVGAGITGGALKAAVNAKKWAEMGMTPEKAKELAQMSWSDANKLEKKQGFNPKYTRKDAVSKANYIKQGLGSLVGQKPVSGSNVGGGTALSQKIFQNPIIKAITNNPIASRAAGLLGAAGTAGLAYGVGKGSYDLTNAAIDKLGVRDNLFDIGASVADSVQARKETKKRIKTKKSEGTFKPRVVAKAKPKTTTKAKAKTTKPVRTPVVTKKATTKKTVKTGPSGTTAKKSSSTPKKGTGSSGPPGRNYSAPAKKSAPVVRKTSSTSKKDRYGRRGGW